MGDGCVFIGYSALLRWNLLRIPYQGGLYWSESTGVVTRSSVNSDGLPVVAPQRISWKPANLEVDGAWQRDSQEHCEIIYASDNGRIEWTCHMPRANVELRFADGRALSGVGYAEHLAMTIAPWDMPIRTLRWGRFHGRESTLIWIDWQGEYSKSIVLLDGDSIAMTSIDESRLSLQDGSRLEFDQSVALRDGALGSTVLRSIPILTQTAPGRILNVIERKWRSRATLSSATGATDTGWAIHEVVQWP